MDADENYLYYSNEKLLGLIALSKDRDEAIREYLRTVKYAPITDFNNGLEWFNVSEPLSFANHLKGKVVVLDFFTYCCINCMHIIPDLREIESRYSVEDGLVVIGVHSAKFENEKLSSNILAAVQRYNISHPVVNDHNSEMWQNCDVHCWPTLLLLGPHANPIVMLTGEGHKDDMLDYIRVTLDYYKQKRLISDHKLPLKSAFHLLPDLKGPLLFPGKIATFLDENDHQILAISDTGNNRILIVDSSGTILNVIGGRKLGFRDGNLQTAQFNNPQGVTFRSKNILYVADTENHAIRKIDLERGTVATVAGTGQQGYDRLGGKPGPEQDISSPWDVCVYRTRDMDLTFHPDGRPPIREVLIIAMAGTHQIWALFLDDTVWWKCKKFTNGTCINIAGSGKEENRNNSYPHAAAFAQPSGLALCEAGKEVYIADSESSSIRRLSLVDGKVTPVVGGDRNPNNLFAFGDQDGVLYEAKLQHALGLAASPDGKTLFVADTYNHKLKRVDISENKVSTLQVSNNLDSTDCADWAFKEPAGLCVSADGKRIYLADTNNHQIKVVSLGRNGTISKVQKLELRAGHATPTTAASPSTKRLTLPLPKVLHLSDRGGKILIKFHISFTDGLKLAVDAPQKWVAELPAPTFACVPTNGPATRSVQLVISAPAQTDQTHVNVSFSLITCSEDSCVPRAFVIRLPIGFSKSAPECVDTEVRVVLDKSGARIQ